MNDQFYACATLLPDKRGPVLLRNDCTSNDTIKCSKILLRKQTTKTSTPLPILVQCAFICNFYHEKCVDRTDNYATQSLTSYVKLRLGIFLICFQHNMTGQSYTNVTTSPLIKC